MALALTPTALKLATVAFQQMLPFIVWSSWISGYVR